MHKITILLFSLGFASCVSQAKYDEALSTAQMYQRSAHDNAEYIAQLEADRENVSARLAAMNDFDAGVVDASYNADIDARMASLRNMLSGIGHDVDEVTMFEVEGGYGYSMSNSVVFSSGSAELSAEGRKLIGGMAQQIVAQPFQRVWVRGHTDSDRVSKASTLERYPNGNIELSSARALEVAMALKASGLSEDKLAVAGLGAGEPVASNATPEGKAQNRRVEIFVIDSASASGQ